MEKNITSQTLSRLPVYFNYLVSLPEERKKGNISATAIAEALGLNDVQVRKDLASVSSGAVRRWDILPLSLSAISVNFSALRTATR